MVVERWLRYWLTTRTRIRPVTLRSYQVHVENHLIPHLGRVRLSELAAVLDDELMQLLVGWAVGRAMAAALVVPVVRHIEHRPIAYRDCGDQPRRQLLGILCPGVRSRTSTL